MHRIYLISWSPHQTPSGQMLNLEVSICPGSVQVLLYSGSRERLGPRTEQRCPIRDCLGELGGAPGHLASPGFPNHFPSWSSISTILSGDMGLEASRFPSPLIYFPSAAFCLHPRITRLLVCPVPQCLNSMWGSRSQGLVFLACSCLLSMGWGWVGLPRPPCLLIDPLGLGLPNPSLKLSPQGPRNYFCCS